MNDVDTTCTAAGQNDECGATGFDDGLCVALDAVTNRCTVACIGNDDCKLGSDCDTTVTPNRCEL